jgi:hypothetical protein
VSFCYFLFRGKTTSPWHVGKRQYSDYLYTRDDYLWGRGVRGPVLRLLWRMFCSKSDARDRVEFSPERDCVICEMVEDCPFANLVGTDDEGEFKDKPRLIITNLRFVENVRKDRVALATLSDKFLGVVEEKAPVFVEYLVEGAVFEFEAILMGEGAKFADHFENAVKTSLRFFGWGGFCNEGFGRGTIDNMERIESFERFNREKIEPDAEKIREAILDEGKLTFKISPLLIVDKDEGGVYKGVSEDGFKEKFCNCIDERFWQFYNFKVYPQNFVDGFSGRARTMKILGWSRRLKRKGKLPFEGLGGELTFHFKDKEKLSVEVVKAFALMKYGVGRFKNQGFGSLRL